MRQTSVVWVCKEEMMSKKKKEARKKTLELLKFVKSCGTDGATLNEMRKFLVGKRKFDRDPSRYRGYWNGAFYGTCGRLGLLDTLLCQTDQSYESSPKKYKLVEGAIRQAKKSKIYVSWWY